MANIKSIGGNPIVVGMDGLTDDAKATLRANRPSAKLSGSLVTADDAAPTTPIDTTVYGQSTQDGTPTPSAPVPIVSVEGDSEGNISLLARGKNLADKSFPTFVFAPSRGVTYTKGSDGLITASGTASQLAYLRLGGENDNPLGLIEGETYTISTTSTSGKIYALTTGGSRASLPYTFEYGDGGYIVGLSVKDGDTVSESFYVQIDVGSTATAYQPYTATVTPIDLDGHELRSLPDGTRDELTVGADGRVTLVQRVGEYTVTGSETVGDAAQFGSYHRIRLSWVLSGNAKSINSANSGWCTKAPFAVGYTAQSTHVYTHDTHVYAFAEATTDAAVLTAYTGAVILYPLATPVTHDLGTVPLAPLVGPDLTAQTVPTAPLALTYERDATIVLDRLTAMWANVAPVEGDTASASYAVGSYLMHGGQLCKVTTAIATGETIAIGTNVVATTVMAEVIALTQ